MSPKVILIFGTAGISTDKCGKKIACELNGIRTKTILDNQYPDSFIEFEKILLETYPEKITIQQFVSQFGWNSAEQKRAWGNASKIIERKIRECTTEYCVISIHLVFYFWHCVKSFVEAKFFRAIKPQVAFTIIDDIYATKKRLDNNKENKKHGIKFSYEQIFSWRSAELMVADFLVSSCGVKKLKNIFMAAKHDVKTFADIARNPDCFKIYLSFPITSTRRSKKDRDYIDEIRFFLHKKFTCFDPLGIDEKRFIIKDNSKIVKIPRWEFGYGKSLIGNKVEEQIKLNKDDMERCNLLNDIISSQITYRDYRYIDQSNCMVICRGLSPKGMKGEEGFSGGVTSEIGYARETKKPVFLFDDNIADLGKYEQQFKKGIVHWEKRRDMIEDLKSLKKKTEEKT